MEYYSTLKNNEILSFAGKWIELKNVILSEPETKFTYFLSYVEDRSKYTY
jgi:hypothetical protein